VRRRVKVRDGTGDEVDKNECNVRERGNLKYERIFPVL
jgi:hypothetical protein